MSPANTPTAQQQLDFLRKIQRLFDEGDFSATYKYALLAALVELAVEKGDDSGAQLPLTMREIAEKFAELYWPQTVPYISRQPGTRRGILNQNFGQQAAVINHLVVLRAGGARTLIETRKHLEWNNSQHAIARGSAADAVSFVEIQRMEDKTSFWGASIDSNVENGGLLALVSAYNRSCS